MVFKKKILVNFSFFKITFFFFWKEAQTGRGRGKGDKIEFKRGDRKPASARESPEQERCEVRVELPIERTSPPFVKDNV